MDPHASPAEPAGAHIVEVRIAYTKGRPDGTLREAPEWQAFREAGIYTPLGEMSFAPVRMEESELRPDPLDDVALLGGRIADAVASGAGPGRRLLMIGGNCASVPGMIGGLQAVHGAHARIGLIWVDAHPDFNTPHTTPSAILGGMPVAVVTGLCHARWRTGARIQAPLPTDRVLMVGTRKRTFGEELLIRATDVATVEIDSPDLTAAVQRLADAVDVVYLHVDLDILDPSLIPSHMAQVPDGPDIEQTVAALGAMLDTGRVDAFAVVSLYATREGGEQSVAAAIALLRPCLARWAAASTPVAA
jgi:arginase